MQRVLLNAGRLGAGATAGIASTSHCRADQAAPSAVTYHEEGDWGFVNLQKHEVTGVLRDLCKASKTSPVITEVDESGSDISTGAEELFARAEDLGAASNLDTLGAPQPKSPGPAPLPLLLPPGCANPGVFVQLQAIL